MKIILFVLMMCYSIVANSATSATNNTATRSKSTVYKFRSTHPCPANGSLHSACPGYVVDHIVALECGGLDQISNMQWQTLADSKAKNKLEHLCRKPK